ncbi:MAG: PKD domain-containing protein, partial [Planctomycetota bacterium]
MSSSSHVRSYRRRVSRRRHLLETLEDRRLLAADTDFYGPVLPAAITNTQAETSETRVSTTANSFGEGLKQAVREISRVVEAIGSSPELISEIPYLGSLSANSVGGTSQIDTVSIRELFRFAERFESEVVEPLEAFLLSNPLASASQLAQQFNFLELVSGLGDGEGVRLNFSIAKQFTSRLDSLLDPITSSVGSLLDVVDGDALGTELPIDFSLDNFSFQFIRDAAENLTVSLPAFNMAVGVGQGLPIDFQALTGFLAGTVRGGSLDFNSVIRFDPVGFGFGSIDLDDLRERSALEILGDFEIEFGGGGLQLDLPFEFELPGFDTGGLFPQFRLHDSNPLDALIPQVELNLPDGAPYSPESILGFGSINATAMLGQLETLGSVFLGWEQGSLLDFPVPLAHDLTIGEAVGLAESYGSAVLQFLSDDEGFPTFNSIQELSDLIPGLVTDASDNAVVFDPETQVLTLSLDLMRAAEPITTQADLSLIAGQNEAPITSFEMTPGDSGLDNRLTISRNASLGLQLEVDLSREASATVQNLSRVPERSALTAQVPDWTPLRDILKRRGLEVLVGSSFDHKTTVSLADGRQAEIQVFGVEGLTIGGLTDFQGRAYIGNEVVAETRFIDNRLVIVDLTEGSNPTSISNSEGFFLFLFDQGSSADGRLESQSLAESEFDRSGGETLLSFLLNDLSTVSAGVPTAPLRLHLSSGEEVVFDPAEAIGNFTIDSFLSAFDLTIGDRQVVRASLDGPRFVIHDLTTGEQTFRIEWAGSTVGSPLIERLISLEEDSDRDGRIVGPRFMPALGDVNDHPVSLEDSIGPLLSRLVNGNFLGTTDTATINLRNGDSIELSTGPLTEDLTVRELLERLQVFDTDGTQLLFAANSGGSFFFLDASDGDAAPSFAPTPNGFFSYFFGTRPAVDNPDVLGVPEYRSVPFTAGVYGNVPLFTILDPTLTEPLELLEPEVETLRFHLRDGTREDISVTIDELLSDSLESIADQVLVERDGVPVIRARVGKHGLIIEDLSAPTGPNSVFRIEAPTQPLHRLIFTAFDQTFESGIAEMSALRSSFDPVATPPDILHTPTTVPSWTPIEDIVTRLGWSDVGDQTWTVSLRRGDQIDLTMSRLQRTRSVGDTARRTAFYEGDTPIVTLDFVDGRFEIVDHTTGPGTTEITAFSGLIAYSLFTDSRDFDNDGRIRGADLSRTLFHVFEEPIPAISLIDTYDVERIATPLEVHFRDGTSETIHLGQLQTTSFSRLAKQLRIDRPLRKKLDVRIVDNRYVLTDLTTPIHGETFSIDWAASFDETSAWPGAFIPIASDANGDGVLTGQPFLPELPTSGKPPINAETRFGDIVDRNPFFRPLLNYDTTDTISATLRSGETVTLTTPVLTDEMTLGELADALRVIENDQTLVDAELIEDRIVLTDLSNGTGDFQLDPNDFEQRFFTVFGLVELGNTSDAITSTFALSTSGVSDSLLLSDLVNELSSQDIEGGTFRVDLADGSTVRADLGMVNATTSLADLLEAITITVSDRTFLRAELSGQSIRLIDLSTPDPSAGPMTVRDIDGVIASALFSPVTDADRDGTVLAASLVPALTATSITPETTLDAFARAAGVQDLLAQSSVVLDVTLSDGVTRTIEVKQHATMTLNEFGRQFAINEAGVSKLISELAVDSESGELTFVVRDQTTVNAPVAEFQILASSENTDSTSSLFAAYLGLIGVDSGGSGVLESRDLREVTNEDRVRIKLTEPPTLRAEIGIAASSLNATAKIGDLLGASFENGYASATAVVEIGIKVPEGQDFISLSDLARSVTNPFESLDVSVDADLTAGGEVAVDLAGLNVPPEAGSVPRIDVTWNDLLTSDPNLRVQPENFEFTTANFDNLINLKKLTLEDITDLIRRVVVFVETVSGEGLLDQPLPLVKRSLGDVLDMVDAVNERVEEILADPNATLDTLETTIEDALGLQPEDFTLTFDPDTQLLKAELDLAIEDVNETASFDVDLSDFIGPDVSNFTDQFVDFSGSGSFDLTAGAEVRAHLGLDLNQLRNVAFDDAVVVFDTTGIVATASANASNLDFETSILSLGVSATGNAAFDRDGLDFNGGSDSNEPAEFQIAATPGQWPGGMKSLLSLSPSDFEIDFDNNAAAGVNLQLATVTGAPITEAFQIKWEDLDSFEFGTEGISAPGNQLIVPDLSSFLGDLTLADSLQALASGLQALFGSIDEYLGDEILGIEMPFVGDGLSGVVNVAENFSGILADALAAGAEPGELVSVAGQRILFDVLGPGTSGAGLNVLLDTNGDGQITPDDVEIIVNSPATAGEGEGIETEASYRIRLGRNDITATTPLDLDLGGSGLGLEISGDASVNAEYGFELVIGFTQNEGAFIEFDDGPDLFVGFDAAIDDLVGDARLGPLAVSIATIDENAPSITEDQRERVRLADGTSAFNGIAGRFGLDFPTGRFSLGSIGSALLNVEVVAEVVGGLSASIDTGVNTSIEGIPSIVADLHVNFDHVDGTIDEVLATFADPQISITDAGLDLGSFVSNVLAPILEPVNDFLDPVRPVLEQLTTPIPVLSELIGPTTYVDLISAFGDGGETVARFVDAVAEIVALLDIPINSDEIILPLGSFSTAFDAQLGKLIPTSTGGATEFDSFLNDLGENFSEMRDYLASIPQEEPRFSATDPNKIASVGEGMFSIPLLQNPASAIGLLFGDDVDLIKYQAPQLNVGFDFQIGIPVFPVFNITVGGQLNAIIDFAFGYDTAGIRKFAETRRALDLLDGFFFDDRAEFDDSGNKTSDVPELTFRFAVTAGGELDLKAAKAGVEVGLGASLLLDLNDPNLDGKVRFAEVQQNLQLGNAPGLGPLWVFDASGQLDAFLTAYAKAFGIRVQATLGPKVLIDFDFPRPVPATPTLGRVEPDGRLIVHVGPESDQRIEGDLSDGDDVLFVSTNEDNGKTVITGFGTDQEFDGVTSVLIDSGFGDDQIVIDQNFVLPVTVLGGYGDDEITGGGGQLTARGGWGDDVISGGSADDMLYGEGSGLPNETTFIIPTSGETVTIFHTDRDLIDGGLGNDFIAGGPEADQLQGGAGNDEIDGGDGEDYLGGGEGDDTLRGGADDDVLSGDKGNDLAQGGAGMDFLQGGPGADRLEGGDHNDELFGGTGGDELIGGLGDDLLVGAVTTRDNPDFEAIQAALDFDAHTFDGGEGNDLIYGTAGPDTVIDVLGVSHVFTYEGADTITTGDESDLIRSGAGDDEVNVGGGRNRVFTGAGFDIVRAGDEADLIDLRPPVPGAGSSFGSQVFDTGGGNRILGDSGPDVITVTGSGNTFIDAGDGDNRITTSLGDDTIRTGNGVDLINAGDGNNEISTGAGDDDVTTGSGDDSINTASGMDRIEAGPGADSINAGAGDDVIVAGLGNDTVFAGPGRDVVWGGLEFFTAAELFGSLIEPTEFSVHGTYNQFVPPAIQPAVVGDESVRGEINDGNDYLAGGPGGDLVFGGGGNDDLIGGLGDNFLDGGAGVDFLFGGPGVDLIRGGNGNDELNGGLGIDLLFGGDDDDTLRGDGGDEVGPNHLTFGQMLFGGAGNDTLLAYANSTDVTLESTFDGDRLDGGEGLDLVRGNLRREVLIGGGGKDILEGDRLGGPNYATRQGDAPLETGADDELFGGPGDDQIFAHGGDDTAWGGSGTDILQGHAGVDFLRGGTGIDLLYLDTETTAIEQLDGFFGNETKGDTEDDNATDVLVIQGTSLDDVIQLGGSGGRLVVQYQTGTNARTLTADFRNDDGEATLKQFQIDALAGDDWVEFLPSLDLGEFAARSRDWVSVINAGSGDDTVLGSMGRDRVSGGPGSDILKGLAGDDRLFGDDLDGSPSIDNDRLFAGSGNDDLFGGVGSNQLFAWSDDPTTGNAFGRFVDPGTGQVFDDLVEGRIPEDTGLNRMLGRDGDDDLFGGTALDFMYGGGGLNRLFDVNGDVFEVGAGVPSSEEWIEYARSTDAVWYYGATDADDVITVDFVTEPGILGDHHLITRLTENEGLFTFDAQVQLDFSAVDDDGQLIWDPSDLVIAAEELGLIQDVEQLEAAQRDLELSGNLLPPEGDYLAIVIDAKDGDDEVYVGPTVQRSIWVSAGDGDDIVEIASGTALLVDQADSASRNEVPNDANDFSRAYLLESIDTSKLFTNLTLDSASDVDWYEIEVNDLVIGTGNITVDSVSAADDIQVALWERESDGIAFSLLNGVSSGSSGPDPNKPIRVEIPMDGFNFDSEFTYFIRVQSGSQIPTQYDLGITFDERPFGDLSFDLGSAATDDFLRRDVIVGGPGRDRLQGGPSEDWVIGGAGDDVLAGGFDRGASDVLIGEDGNDLLQVYLDEAPVDNFGVQGVFTLADELEGGDGFDQVLIQGGDVDSLGNPIRDHLTLSYNIPLGITTVAGLVWDAANDEFIRDIDGKLEIYESQFQARGVEGTLIDLRGGDDEVHLEADYQFAGSDPQNDPTYGISPGDRQAGGSHLRFHILGGDGNDRIFGSPYGDQIDAGAGIDFVSGLEGDDDIRGGTDDDVLSGGGSNVTPIDTLEAFSRNGTISRNDAAIFATPIEFDEGSVGDLTFHQGDAADWYVVPLPESGILTASDFENGITFENAESNASFYQSWNEPLATITPAVFDTTSNAYLPTFPASNAEAYLLGITNPRTRAVIANSPIDFSMVSGTTSIVLSFTIDGGRRFGGISFQVDAATSGPAVADAINARLQAVALDDEIFAEFDTRENRLLIVLRQSGTLQINGSSDQLGLLGFTQSQTNSGPATELGNYSITTTRAFADAAGPKPPSEVYRAELSALRSVADDQRETLTLAPAGTASLQNAARLDGEEAFGELRLGSVVGDLNGDGFDDLVLSSNNESLVLFGPVNVDGLQPTADLRLDLSSSADQPNWTAVESSSDLDGDGLTDLLFHRLTRQSGSDVRLDVAALTGAMIVEGASSVEDDGVLAVSIDVSGGLSPDDVQLQWMNYDASPEQELLVFTSLPVIEQQSTNGYGGVLLGSSLAGAIRNTRGPAVAGEMIAWLLGGIENDNVVLSTLPGYTAATSPTLPTSLRERARATVLDADGDGQDEVLVSRPMGWLFQNTTDRSEYITVGRNYLLDLNGSVGGASLGASGFPAVIQLETAIQSASTPDLRQLIPTMNPTQPLLAGDFDLDGTDELIVARGASDTGADLLVFEEIVGGLKRLDDARLQLDNVVDEVSELRSMGLGDFDGDHHLDLVLGADRPGTLVSEVRVLYDPLTFTGSRLDVANDPRIESDTFRSLTPAEELGTVARISRDFTGDGIADLALGAGAFDAVADGIETNAGAVFLLPGQIRPGSIPEIETAITLENTAVRGIGGAVVDQGANVTFTGSDFRLSDGNDTQLFRFRTLGDGAGGDVLRVGPGLGIQPIVPVEGLAASLEPGGDAQYPFAPIDVGGSKSNIGLIEFDFGKLMSALVNPDRLLGAELNLLARSDQDDTNITIDLLPSDGDGFFRDPEDDWSNARALFTLGTINLGKNPQRIELDLAPVTDGIEGLRELLRRGERYLTARITTDHPSALVTVAAPDRSLDEPTGLLLRQQPGAIATLFDEEGRVLQADSPGFDLRNLDAGTYYLQVMSADPASQEGSVDFELTFDAPGLGAFDPPTDNDLVQGGGGDDILLGGPGKDALAGESGSDSFTAEFFETRDRETEERLREPVGDDLLGERLFDDPLVVIDPDLSEDAPRGVIEIADGQLARAIGDAIDVAIVSSPDGGEQFARTIRASELGGIVSLDLSSLGIFNLAGLEALAGLVSLDLSDNGLTPFDLEPLSPTDTGGLANLQFLNLDRNNIDFVGGLPQLTALQALSLNFNGGEEGSLDNIDYLETLEELQYASFDSADIESPGGLFKTYLGDDNEEVGSAKVVFSEEWRASVSSVPVVGDIYHYAEASTDAKATYQFPFVSPGQYEVLATWRASEANAASVRYESRDRFATTVNQRAIPVGHVFNGIPFQTIGTIDLTTAGALDIDLSASSDEGLLIADAVLIRPVEPTVSGPLQLVLTDNFVNEGFHQVIAASIEEQVDVTLRLPERARPTWLSPPSAVVGSLGERLVLDLSSNLSVANGQSLSIRDNTRDENLIAFGSPAAYNVRQLTQTAGASQLLLTARGTFGRSTTTVIEVGFGGSIVEGRVFEGVSDLGIPATTVFLDELGDGQLDIGTDVSQVSDLDGKFHVFSETTTPEKLSTVPQEDWLTTPTAINVPFDGLPRVLEADIKANHAITFDLPSTANEGDYLTPMLFSPTGTELANILWSATGPVTVEDETSVTAGLDLEQGGIVTVTLQAEDQGGVVYRTRRTVSVLDVAPIVNAGPDIVVVEGPFVDRRLVIDDAGDDLLTITIDYGDGSDPTPFVQSARPLDFDHLYGTPGQYTVGITVEGADGSSFDSFEVTVEEAGLAAIVDPLDFAPVKGVPTSVQVKTFDASFQADAFVFDSVIDWGDGTIESIGENIMLSDGTLGREGVAIIDHVYENEGTFVVTFTQTDDDGTTVVATTSLTIGNDAPIISAILPTDDGATAFEDSLLDFGATATDQDGTSVPRWDFGDGSPNVFGNTVRHAYSDPGTYNVSVEVTDGQGLSTTESFPLVISNVVDPPSVRSIPAQMIRESEPWTFAVEAIDVDGAFAPGEVEYELLDDATSDGLSIDSEGVIRWTPTTAQGPLRYEYRVEVTKSGASTIVPLTIDVLESGSIGGMIFEDTNGNGLRDGNETTVAGATIHLDMDDDGDFDQTIVSTDGSYRFNGLALGVYRVVADFESGWETTTPREVLVDMDVAMERNVADLGGRPDSDGDGVSNFDEQNSPAGLDGNSDGVSDWLQGNVLSVQTSDGPMTLVSPLGTLLSDAMVSPALNASGVEAVFPHDRVSFNVSGLASSGRAEVQLFYGARPSINAIFSVDDRSGEVFFRQLGQTSDERVVVGDTRTTIDLRDGSVSDLDASTGALGLSVQLARTDMPQLKRYELGRIGSGIAVDDDATGRGFLMFSGQNVFARFPRSGIPVANSDHLLAVRFLDGVWSFNNNATWVEFRPVSSDRLLAAVDFDADTVESLRGGAGHINGIEQGFLFGDLSFAADRWGGKANDGEFMIEGTFFEAVPTARPSVRVALGLVNRGIAVSDDATGTGFILFSDESVHTRFRDNPVMRFNSDHLIAVRVVDGEWFYNNNRSWFPFTPRLNDRLIASVDFDSDTITSLAGASGRMDGISQGYLDGDLTFFADRWNGSANDGEFTVLGTYFDVDAEQLTQRFDLGPINNGIAVEDNVTVGWTGVLSECNRVTIGVSVIQTYIAV